MITGPISPFYLSDLFSRASSHNRRFFRPRLPKTNMPRIFPRKRQLENSGQLTVFQPRSVFIDEEKSERDYRTMLGLAGHTNVTNSMETLPLYEPTWGRMLTSNWQARSAEKEKEARKSSRMEDINTVPTPCLHVGSRHSTSRSPSGRSIGSEQHEASVESETLKNQKKARLSEPEQHQDQSAGFGQSDRQVLILQQEPNIRRGSPRQPGRNSPPFPPAYFQSRSEYSDERWPCPPRTQPTVHGSMIPVELEKSKL
jgi:hypothetical protein